MSCRHLDNCLVKSWSMQFRLYVVDIFRFKHGHIVLLSQPDRIISYMNLAKAILKRQFHRICRAFPPISLEDCMAFGVANYNCMLSLPIAGFRKLNLHMRRTRRLQNSGFIFFCQHFIFRFYDIKSIFFFDFF